jgi:hypothetical protein
MFGALADPGPSGAVLQSTALYVATLYGYLEAA